MWRPAPEQRLKSVETQSGCRQGRQTHAAHAWKNVKCFRLPDCSKLLELVRRAPYLVLFFTFWEPSAKSNTEGFLKKGLRAE